MLINSTVIKLRRRGNDIAPEYSLTIYGNGKVIYDGVENVKVKGMVESSIESDKVIFLLSQFKETGFFSLNDVYSVEDSIDRPYTIISISIPKENGEMATKNIKYHHGDKNVPKKLKILENKIDEIVGTNRWVGDLSEYEEFKLKKETKTGVKTSSHKKMSLEFTKKKPTKLIAVGVSFIVVIVVLLYAMESGILSLPPEEKELPDGSSTGYSPLEITNLTTASSVYTSGDYDQSVYFEQGDTVYIYHEYTNITIKDDTKCDISIEIAVSLDGEVYHSDSYYESNVKNFSKLNFTTDESWPSGNYLVIIALMDNISKKSNSSQTNFILIEKFSENPEITILDPASEVRGYQDYDPKSVFYRNETIFIYQEYTNITAINISECDLYLDIVVTIDDIIVHSDIFLKSEVGNNAHYWYFTSNVSWTSGIYSVTANLRDNITNKSTSLTKIFTLI